MKNFFTVMIALVFSSAIFYSAAYPASKEKPAKKILIVYYSLTGTTKGVAEEIAKNFNADVEQITDKKDRSGKSGAIVAAKDAELKNTTEIGATVKNPADYDLVIIGTPIWMGSTTPAMHTYLIKNKSSFINKKVAFFTTAGSYNIDKIIKELEEYSGVKAAATAGFIGKDFKPEGKKNYDKKMTDFITALSALKVK